MGFWSTLLALDAAPDAPASPRIAASSVDSLIPPGTQAQAWEYTAPVSRSDAESVPACSRGVDLIASTVAGLPVQRFKPNGDLAPLGWLEQPEPARPRFATFNDLVRDLIYTGDAWLLGGPLRGCTYLPPSYVQLTLARTPTPYGIPLFEPRLNGNPAPANLIRFYGWHNGILNHGARIIRTALALQGAAKKRADSPLPQTTLKNNGTELGDPEIDALLAAYRKARAEGATAYINAAVDEMHNGWSSVELQMVEAQQFYNSQIANLIGMPAHFIAGSNMGGSSLTYTSVVLENQQLSQYSLNPPIKSLEAVLTQIDPDGCTVRFNLAGLLRGSPTEVAALVAQLHPLGLITDAEARAWLDMAAAGGI